MSKETLIDITADCRASRLDQFLAAQLPELSRSKIQNLIKAGQITHQGKILKARHPVEPGDCFQIKIPAEKPAEPQAEAIPLNILFEDDSIIVVNKPPGLVVHPANGNESGTLVNALLHHCKGQLARCAGVERPGIVHRLDKDTSGCLIAAKTDAAHRSLTQQFAERTTDKRYFAVAQGQIAPASGTVFTQIGRHPLQRQKMAVLEPPAGKAAITDYEAIDYLPDLDSSLVLCTLHTGRTHQIRVHMLHLGHPLVGDPIYAKTQRQKAQPGRLMLHAWQLSINHPESGKRLEFEAPLPAEFRTWTEASRARE